MKTNFVKEQLNIEVYTIGYEPMGEGIVIKLIIDDCTAFCAIIDCFELKNLNKTLEIIKDEKIDLICMTHPDLDHCKGLDEVLKLSNSDTKILYPQNVFTKKYNNKDINNVLKKISKFEIMRKDNKKKPCLIPCLGDKKIIPKVELFDINQGTKYDFSVDTYTPLANIDRNNARSFLGMNEIEIENNEFSIMMSLSVGDLKILLCGDIEDNTIIELDKYTEKRRKWFL